jgi:hypothetical protein
VRVHRATARVAGAGGGCGALAYTWWVPGGTLPARFGARRLMPTLGCLPVVPRPALG